MGATTSRGAGSGAGSGDTSGGDVTSGVAPGLGSNAPSSTATTFPEFTASDASTFVKVVVKTVDKATRQELVRTWDGQLDAVGMCLGRGTGDRFINIDDSTLNEAHARLFLRHDGKVGVEPMGRTYRLIGQGSTSHGAVPLQRDHIVKMGACSLLVVDACTSTSMSVADRCKALMVNNRPNENTDSVCYVCFEDHDTPQDPLVYSPCPCSHRIHYKCLREWIDKKGSRLCSICKGKFPLDITVEPPYIILQVTRHMRGLHWNGEREYIISFASTPRAAISIGSATDCDVSLPDPSLSRLHARVSYNPVSREFLVEDMRSSAGTFLRVLAPCALTVGSVWKFKMGRSMVRVQVYRRIPIRKRLLCCFAPSTVEGPHGPAPPPGGDVNPPAAVVGSRQPGSASSPFVDQRSAGNDLAHSALTNARTQVVGTPVGAADAVVMGGTGAGALSSPPIMRTAANELLTGDGVSGNVLIVRDIASGTEVSVTLPAMGGLDGLSVGTARSVRSSAWRQPALHDDTSTSSVVRYSQPDAALRDPLARAAGPAEQSSNRLRTGAGGMMGAAPSMDSIMIGHSVSISAADSGSMLPALISAPVTVADRSSTLPLASSASGSATAVALRSLSGNYTTIEGRSVHARARSPSYSPATPMLSSMTPAYDTPAGSASGDNSTPVSAGVAAPAPATASAHAVHHHISLPPLYVSGLSSRSPHAANLSSHGSSHMPSARWPRTAEGGDATDNACSFSVCSAGYMGAGGATSGSLITPRSLHGSAAVSPSPHPGSLARSPLSAISGLSPFSLSVGGGSGALGSGRMDDSANSDLDQMSTLMMISAASQQVSAGGGMRGAYGASMLPPMPGSSVPIPGASGYDLLLPGASPMSHPDFGSRLLHSSRSRNAGGSVGPSSNVRLGTRMVSPSTRSSCGSMGDAQRLTFTRDSSGQQSADSMRLGGFGTSVTMSLPVGAHSARSVRRNPASSGAGTDGSGSARSGHMRDHAFFGEQSKPPASPDVQQPASPSMPPVSPRTATAALQRGGSSARAAGGIAMLPPSPTHAAGSVTPHLALDAAPAASTPLSPAALKYSTPVPNVSSV